MVEAASRRFPVHLAILPPGTRQDAESTRRTRLPWPRAPSRLTVFTQHMNIGGNMWTIREMWMLPASMPILALALAVNGCETSGKRKVNDPCTSDDQCEIGICHRAVCGAEQRRGLSSPCSGHGDCKSFVCSLGATELRFDMAGLSLVKSPTVDLRSKGKIKFTDPLLQATNNLIYFHSELTAKNASGHRSEKRTYKAGTFRFLDATGKVLATGTFDHVNVITDYDTYVHHGWGQLTVAPGSALYTELVAAFGKATMLMKVGSLQAPVWMDNPTGTISSQMYAVYNATMTLTGIAPGICK